MAHLKKKRILACGLGSSLTLGAVAVCVLLLQLGIFPLFVKVLLLCLILGLTLGADYL